MYYVGKILKLASWPSHIFRTGVAWAIISNALLAQLPAKTILQLGRSRCLRRRWTWHQNVKLNAWRHVEIGKRITLLPCYVATLLRCRQQQWPSDTQQQWEKQTLQLQNETETKRQTASSPSRSQVQWVWRSVLKETRSVLSLSDLTYIFIVNMFKPICLYLWILLKSTVCNPSQINIKKLCVPSKGASLYSSIWTPYATHWLCELSLSLSLLLAPHCSFYFQVQRKWNCRRPSFTCLFPPPLSPFLSLAACRLPLGDGRSPLASCPAGVEEVKQTWNWHNQHAAGPLRSKNNKHHCALQVFVSPCWSCFRRCCCCYYL